MKIILRKILPIVIVATSLYSTQCYSDATSPLQSEPGAEPILALLDIQYTFVKDCKESIANDNAAYSLLECPNLGEYKVSIARQDPQYFNVILQHGAKEASSDFISVSGDKPVEAGKAIEWHLQNNMPTYMIFRLSWGRDDELYKFREHLLINLVTSNEICVLATIDIKNNRNANEKARGLLRNEYKNIKSCPEKIQTY